VSTQNPLLSLPASDDARVLRVIAVGSLDIVNNYVLTQHRLGFAEVSDWSRPLPAPNPGDVMRILTKRFGAESAAPHPADTHSE
jgi:hypothetical protein